LEDPDEDVTANKISRRDALVRAAKLGGAIAWAVPLVQTVDIRAAAALAGSAEPQEPPIDETGGSVNNGTGAGEGGAGGDGSGGEGGGGGSGGGGATTISLEIVDLTAAPNPLRIRRGARLRIGFSVSAVSVVQIMIVRGDRVVRRFKTRELTAAGAVQTRWNGRNRRGKVVRAGRYDVVVQAADALGGTTEARIGVRVTS
jgi:hypothetical protein